MKSIIELEKYLQEFSDKESSPPTYDQLIKLLNEMKNMVNRDYVHIDKVKMREEKLIRGAFDLVVDEITLLYPRQVYKNVGIDEFI